jgi:hypothetical protein
MVITLSDEDVITLRGLVKDHLPALKFEVVRTRGKEILEVLEKRQELCERLLVLLDQPSN